MGESKFIQKFVLGLCVCLCVSLSTTILALYTGNDAAYERYQQLQFNKRSKVKWRFCYGVRDLETGTVADNTAYQLARVYYNGPRPAPPLFFPSRPNSAYLCRRSFATSCPAQRRKTDVQSGLPADAAILRETGSVDRYGPECLHFRCYQSL